MKTTNPRAATSDPSSRRPASRASTPRPATPASKPSVRAPDGLTSPATADHAMPVVVPLRGSKRATTNLSTPPKVGSSRPSLSRPAEPYPLPDADALGGLNGRSATPQSSPNGRTLAASSTGRRSRSDARTPTAASSKLPGPVAHDPNTRGDHRLGPALKQAGPAATPGSESSPDSLLDPLLCFAADILNDLEKVVIAQGNRLRQMTRTEVDKDGEVRGLGYDESYPVVAQFAAMVRMLQCGPRRGRGRLLADGTTTVPCCLLHEAERNLERQLKAHPLHPWVQAQKGVGLKQSARLLAAIGDPYIRPEWTKADGTLVPQGPRTVSALRAYSGLHVLAGVAARRRKGEQCNWSTTAKMRAYLIAESCIKQLHPDCRDGHGADETHTRTAVPASAPQPDSGQLDSDSQVVTAAAGCGCSPYRVVYDNRRARTATTHPDWSDGHSHNDGLRIASKAVLKDLWIAARDWHHAQERGG